MYIFAAPNGCYSVSLSLRLGWKRIVFALLDNPFKYIWGSCVCLCVTIVFQVQLYIK